MPADHVDDMIREWAASAPNLDVSALEVVGRLLLAAETLQGAIVAALRPLGLSYGDFDVLSTLLRRGDPDGVNPRDLARSALITSGAMTARVDRLHAAGLVDRVHDETDRRQVRIRLTAKGTRLTARAVDAVLEADEEFLAPLGDRQRASAARLLRTLLER
ncbi:DNA-binding MarR family transcriptional regulator [Herbihabitans rhizosphaerae]|uniref:DNA-binding MarR family transcriptional regulator n=1 Tax=Herbihabitans rhizosphaerae TaxID=1872711 RepID=A0A4Q7KMG8_9PSEU|nr:MarR family transcriptional regulator [Herbihabitans rhizosphaerae]RZS37504.1 DNA-binding MarR family transcriptional regulator [Herbihabitans rhizosphaerae]